MSLICSLGLDLHMCTHMQVGGWAQKFTGSSLCHLCDLPGTSLLPRTHFFFSISHIIAVCLWPSGRRTERKKERKKNAVRFGLTSMEALASLNGEESSPPLEFWLLKATVTELPGREQENEGKGDGKLDNFPQSLWALELPFSTSETRTRGFLLEFSLSTTVLSVGFPTNLG